MTRNDLIEKLVDVLKDSKYDNSIFDTAYRAANAIGDVQPIAHGEWEDVTSSLDCNYKTYNCSACNSMRLIDYKSNFCPECGAKMR